MFRKIGNRFDKSYKLNLLPGVHVPPGMYNVNIRYTTHVGSNIVLSTMTETVSPIDWHVFTYIVGEDVIDVELNMSSLCSYSRSGSAQTNMYFYYLLRVDHLIMLNLAYKLLRGGAEWSIR